MDAYIGTAELKPCHPVVVGSYASWHVVYTVGELGMDDGARLRIAHKLVTDWGQPQTCNPRADNYTTAETGGTAALQVVYDRKTHLRPYLGAVTVLVRGSALAPGETITVTFGDRRAGSPGQLIQSFAESGFPLQVSVDPYETGVFRTVGTVRIPVIAAAAYRVVALAPSRVGVGESFAVTLRVEDRWGNTCPRFNGSLLMDVPGEGQRGVSLGDGHPGWVRVQDLSIIREGISRVAVHDPTGNLPEALSNPIEVTQDGYRLFWADLHGQTEETAGTGTIDEYLAFARGPAALDVAAHQAHGFQLDDASWETIRRKIDEYHATGEFITFLGYEWSANTPLGGDHNVLFVGADGPLHRASSWMIPESQFDDAHHITALWDVLPSGEAMTIPHVGGRRANLRWHDAAYQPAVEICSSHGRFEWFYREALSRGYRVGVVGASDDCIGRPGANHPTRGLLGARNGLTAIMSRSLTSEALWEALFKRQTYATSGERILLRFFGDGHTMGSEYSSRKSPVFRGLVEGTAGIARMQIIRDGELVHEFIPPASNESSTSHHLRFEWTGQRTKDRGKHLDWSGQIAFARTERVRVVRRIGMHHPSFTYKTRPASVHEPAIVSWTSATVGNIDGFVFEVPASYPGDAPISFQSCEVSCDLTLEEVHTEGPLVFEGDHLGSSLRVEEEPLSRPRTAAFEWTDTAFESSHWYYLRVVQEDGEMAWSSPIWVSGDRES